MQFLN